MAGVSVVMALLVFLIYFAILGIGIANYIMTSLGLYRIASRRQITHPWMAWVPIVSSWLIGKIAREYDERNGHRRPWNVALLTMNIIAVAGFVLFYIVFFAIMIYMTMNHSYDTAFSSFAVSIMIVLYIGIIAAALAAVAASFCTGICFYKIFESTVPEKALKYIILYLLVPLGSGICLLKCKDKGYPEPPKYDYSGYQDYNGYAQQSDYAQPSGYAQQSSYTQQADYVREPEYTQQLSYQEYMQTPPKYEGGSDIER